MRRRRHLPLPREPVGCDVKPLLVLNVVGLTPSLLAHTPRLAALGRAGYQATLGTVLPAVTCSAQATMLTGRLPRDHGIVGNGWYVRDLAEVLLWRQSNGCSSAARRRSCGTSAGAGSAPASPWPRCSGGTTCMRRSIRRSHRGRSTPPTAARFPASTPPRRHSRTTSRGGWGGFRSSTSGAPRPTFAPPAGSPPPPGR